MPDEIVDPFQSVSDANVTPTSLDIPTLLSAGLIDASGGKNRLRGIGQP